MYNWDFDSGTFQVGRDDRTKPLAGPNVYFMFGDEYSFTMDNLVVFLKFLLERGILDDIQVNAADIRQRLA